MLAIGSVGSLEPRAAGRRLPLPRRLHRPPPRALHLRPTRAPTARRVRPRWRERSGRGLGRPAAPALRDGGVYWQTIGPRFETPAEIRLIAAHADVVGMTIASECIVAGELGLSYAAICVVDNLANGIGASALSLEEMEADRDANAARLRDGARGGASPALARVEPDERARRATPLAVTGAVLDGETVGLRCEDGLIAALGPDVAPPPGDETIDAARRAADTAAPQRPHPRGDDALPRLRRRPAADALAAGEDLAGRGEARGRRRLLGHPARLRGDDPHRHHPLLGHVLAPGGDRPRRLRRRAAGDDRRAALRPRRRYRGDARDGAATTSTGWTTLGSRHRARAHPARDLHGQRGAAALDRRARRRARASPSISTSPRPSRRSTDCLAAHGVRPAAYLDRLGMLGRAHACSPTASGSTRPSWS